MDEFAQPCASSRSGWRCSRVGSLVIAAIGQYAVIAFDMRRRTRDFGVRIALGASSQQILGSVIGEGLRWTGRGTGDRLRA